MARQGAEAPISGSLRQTTGNRQVAKAVRTIVPDKRGRNLPAAHLLRRLGIDPKGLRTATNVELSEDHLAEVALVYSCALSVGLHPSATVAKVFGLTERAASQRVGVARREGFLPATTPGRAKGVPL